MDFTNLHNNQEMVSKLIKNSFDQNRLFHIYLFNGPRGSLKMDAAIYLASLVLCENHNACGTCDECIRLEKWNNPHLFIVSPEGESIKKEQIEELEHEFGYSSDYARVFIIQNIDKATLTAANTLLKFLEELPDNCYGVLLTENINKVIPTIKSRSSIVNFLPIRSEVVAAELVKKGIDQEKSNIMSKLTNNLSLALRYTKDKDIEKIIEGVKDVCLCIEDSNSAYLEFVNNLRFLANLDRDKNRIFIDLLVTIINDIINVLINRREKIVFSSVEYMNIKLSREKHIKLIETILKYRERIETNANIDMIYNGMFLEMDRIIEE